jgi:hypothetical protein
MSTDALRLIKGLGASSNKRVERRWFRDRKVGTHCDVLFSPEALGFPKTFLDRGWPLIGMRLFFASHDNLYLRRRPTMNKSKNALSFSLLSLLFASVLGMAFAQRPQPTPPPRTTGRGAVVLPSPQSPVALNCVPRAGQSCDADGYGCLVMFPDGGWPSNMRKTREVEKQSLSGKAHIDGKTVTLRYEFTSSPSTGVSTIPLDHDIPLGEKVSKLLGYSSVTILKGKYVVDPTTGTFGGLVFNVKVTARIVR